MKTLLAVVVAAAGLVSCAEPDSFVVKEDAGFSQEAFMQKAGAFPYAAPQAKHAQILGAYGKLAVGMGEVDVANLLGQPDLKGSVTAEKTKRSNTSWLYVLGAERPAPDRLDVKQGVALYFDGERKLFWATPKGLPDLQDTGSAESDRVGRYTLYW